MAVYAVVNVRITDPDSYAEYRAKAPATISHYGGKYLARGGAVEVLEGKWDPQRLVILEFESIERFHEWYDSPEYAPSSVCVVRPAPLSLSLSKDSKRR